MAHRRTVTFDWDDLRDRARSAAERAYAPYSRLRVGAAGVASDGRFVTGCNVENSSYGLTLCAECGLVSALHAGAPDAPAPHASEPHAFAPQPAGPRLLAVAIVAGDGAPLIPCGRCRQLLLEAGGRRLLVDTARGPRELAELLPEAFTDVDLAARRDA